MPVPSGGRTSLRRRQIGSTLQAAAATGQGGSSGGGIATPAPAPLAIPMPTTDMLPYRLRILRGASATAPTPQYVWALFRDAQDNHALSDKFDTPSGMVSVTMNVTSGGAFLNHPENPVLVYDRAGGAGLAVEGLLVHYKVTA